MREVRRPVLVKPGQTYKEIGVRSHGRGVFHKELITGDHLGDKRVFWLKPGTLVFNIVFAWERAVAVLSDGEEGMIGSHRFPTYEMLPGRAHAGFLKHYFTTGYGHYLLQLNSPGAAGRNKTLNQSSLMKEDIWLPAADTQKAIAAFLDRKTTAIDALIEKKQKLLDLLAEKRAALINQAVTKGLDPNVPMKDSGIPWIGEIPAHWHTRKLRYIAAKLQGRIIVQPHLYFADEGVPIVFGYNIKNGKIDEGGLSKVSFEADAAHSHARARAGDLYTVRLGSPGMTAVVPQSLDGCHFASIMWVHQHQRADPHWLCHAMNSAVVQGQIDEANYGATLSQFNIADAVDWVLPFPPKAEQVAIAAFLNARLDGDLASNKVVTKQISLLQEYRQAIITAAVTGQLDISEEAA